jgi:3-deoxy-7-phosphoheptulonate synthase
MGGDCAESFQEFSTNHIQDTLRVMLQMASVISSAGSIPVVSVGRMAGQFAKPRSESHETVDGVTLPSYRGDIINSEAFTVQARTPDPRRMLAAYRQSAQTLDVLRAGTSAVGGEAAPWRLLEANLAFAQRFPPDSTYRQLRTAIELKKGSQEAGSTEFFTAHECLLLPYEEALTRFDGRSGRWLDLSAHMLWVGERTRQLDHAHLHFVSGTGNPVGIKLSDKCDPDELLRILRLVNRDDVPGRVVLIVRMGAEMLREKLPALIRAVQDAGRSVVWCCDPMHGNTVKAPSGQKTRPFDRICAEVRAFFEVHAEMGTHAGGVHLEMTGADVTECLGGGVDGVLEQHLGHNYRTACDPRLNGNQALELSFFIAQLMRDARS